MKTTKRTLAELRLRHAQLTDRAERLRERSRAMNPTTPALSAVMRDIRQTEVRALEYAALIRIAEGME